MYLIIGLGNPEKDYAKTRHNMGFNVINKISEKYNIEVTKSKFKSLMGNGIIEGEKVVLLKPQTFMNLSGEAVKEAMDFYKLTPDDIIIIYDDIDTEPETIRIRKNGSAGSHNGMKSVIEYLGTEKFTRIRVGIGAPKFKNDMITYVIGHVPEEEMILLNNGVDTAKDAVIEIIKNNVDLAMNKFNKKKIIKSNTKTNEE